MKRGRRRGCVYDKGGLSARITTTVGREEELEQHTCTHNEREGEEKRGEKTRTIDGAQGGPRGDAREHFFLSLFSLSEEGKEGVCGASSSMVRSDVYVPRT